MLVSNSGLSQLVSTMKTNESIRVEEIFTSYKGTLELDYWEKISTSIFLILCSAVGLSIKGLFLYFLQFKAPKNRPINTLMWFDQVRYFF